MATKLAPSKEYFTTDGGRRVASSLITDAMVRVLDSADDAGCLTGSAVTLNKLVALGLAEDRRMRGVFITGAGWNALALFPLLDAPTVEAHQTRTATVSDGARQWKVKPSGRALGWRTGSYSVASCSCGWSHYAASRGEARSLARVHRAG